MDRVLSARVSETVANQIGLLAGRLHTSKKKVIENAIQEYSAKLDKELKREVFMETWGAWKRRESAAELVEQIRKVSRDSLERHFR